MTHSNTTQATKYPRDKLPWLVPDEVFVDRSRVADWRKVESFPWIPQYEGYELTFDIYEHDGQFWKLYRARWKASGAANYRYSYGGQACRMAEVRYSKEAVSPHSHEQKQAGEVEWVRVEEVDSAIHEVIRRGEG